MLIKFDYTYAVYVIGCGTIQVIKTNGKHTKKEMTNFIRDFLVNEKFVVLNVVKGEHTITLTENEFSIFNLLEDIYLPDEVLNVSTKIECTLYEERN